MPTSILNKLSIKLIFIIFFLLFSLLILSIGILYKIGNEYKKIEENWIPSVSITKDIRDSLTYLKYSEELYSLSRDEKYRNILGYHRNRIDELLIKYKPLISSESEGITYYRFEKLYLYFIGCRIDIDKKCDDSYAISEEISFYQTIDEINNLIRINENQMNFEITRSNNIIYKYEIIFTFSILSFLLLILFFFVFVIFERLKRKNTIPNRILAGLDNSFHLVYQPIVEINSNRIVGVEVLSRFEDKYGEVTPDTFIPIIKSLDLSWEFTKRVIKSSVKELSIIKDIDSKFKISINIFPTDLEKNILDVLEINIANGFTHNIVFEITEFEGCDNKQVQDNIKKLKELGYRFSIDDFGTGYSNFNTLKDFDIDTLKIDRSLLFDIEDEPVKVVLLENICKMANTLSLNVIAEGIENLNQHKIINESGVKFAQGWLYGKPVKMSCLFEMLAKETTLLVVN
ncbi:EAL domain-containing protein [Vibrio diazotrophicus]|uniref:EAL domain-containing protein n=1 Tax=Vibrio diazotrophicus TaxID=685 RepID=UPI0015E0FCF5|nr:EAL domain-containing protein [Vibrio diazotrophicus]